MKGKKFNPWHDVHIGENEPNIVNAIIEIPKDSQLKYEIDKDTGLLRLDRFLYSAVHYPGDYGFIPQTYWDDHDPLDIIVLTNKPVYPMTLVKIRVIGVVRMIDGDEKDDKIIGVHHNDPRYAEYHGIEDIPQHTLRELKHFFERYKELQGKTVKVLEILNREAAYKDIEIGKKLYKKKFKRR